MKKCAVLVVVPGTIGGGSRHSYDHHWEPSPSKVTVCSFNIQFPCHFTKNDNEILADIPRDLGVSVVQEIVAPPMDGTYSDGEVDSADPQASEFFQAVQTNSFAYNLPEEAIGTGKEVHGATFATGWWVRFFTPDLADGKLASNRIARFCRAWRWAEETISTLVSIPEDP